MGARQNEAFLPPWLDRIVAKYACPYCGAMPGKHCRTVKSGGRICRPHMARIDLGRKNLGGKNK